MTSEIESLKTNEFLRRRKLRLQQVREQSKDIAKKIRQRANVEKLRQTGDLDAKKQQEYFEKQEKLVKRLEVLYAKGLENVGVSHRSASEVEQQDNVTKVDISKVRAKEAATELRKKKQEKLDEKKQLLDRKLQAREAANELSREKSSIVANKLLKPLTNKDQYSRTENALNQASNENNRQTDQEKDPPVTTTDMATQWDFEAQPNEWEPAVPTLSLPKDDKDSLKESEGNIIDSKSDKSKRLDLFALSKEMPSSLRGGNINIPEDRIPIKSSLTLVSEYLQNRGLRLRESDTSNVNKKPSEDLHSIKQIIQRTRASKEGSCVCHVLDGQVLPVPSWQEVDPPTPHSSRQKHAVKSRQFNTVTNSQINKIFSSIRPTHPELLPSPTLRGSSPFRRNKMGQRITNNNNNVEKSRSNSQDSTLNKKNSVTMYNHSTRNTQDIPCHDNKLVVRDLQNEDDAYSQAMREMTADNIQEKVYHKKIQDIRNKVAMTKQSVEKEYKDTINFLNSVPKEKCSKVVKTAYMDDRCQKQAKENRQHKLQQEYRKIEKECRKSHHHCSKSRGKSKSPKVNETDFDNRDFQYSWMPVPESDGSLAIHTIPTTSKQGKSGNTVKFSKVDSYHEYRSRHKHTPPTKDTAGNDKPSQRVVETVLNERSTSDSTDISSISSDTSSVENLGLETKNDRKRKQHKEPDHDMSDAERIIIYKILDSRSDKKYKQKGRIVNDIAKSLSTIEKEHKVNEKDSIELGKKEKKCKNVSKETENRVSFEQVNEGVYKMVNENGNNIASMYFTDDPDGKVDKTGDKVHNAESCSCKMSSKEQQERGNVPDWECSEHQQERAPNVTGQANDTSKRRETSVSQPSCATSTTSFKTVINDKPNALSEDGFVKLVDDAGQEAGKFYIGATGFFKDDAYEMIIQLKKKAGKDEILTGDTEPKSANKTNENEIIASKTNVNDVARTMVREVLEILPEARPLEELSSKPAPQKICSNDTISNTGPPSVIEEKPQNVNLNDANDNVYIAKSATSKSNLVDKGVGTSFQLSYGIPSHMPKTDPIPRPATSTCTQTTLSSPNHRPVLFHMSSSTSTAYMSPPEMVLPKYLRHDFYAPEDDVAYEPIQRVEITQKRDRCQQYPDCSCKRCVHAKRVSVNAHGPTYYRDSDYENHTPPNTVRSCSSGHRHDRNKYRHISHAIPIPNTGTCKCRKCEHRVKSCVQTHSPKYKLNSGGHKRPNRNINTRAIVTHSTDRMKQTMPGSNKKNDNSKLNPLIKDYVNKLLNLNREGVKVIEVVDQECSSVTTPGSSIINVPYNVDERKETLGNKISLEQIKDMIRKRIIEEHARKIEKTVKDTSLDMKNNNRIIPKPPHSRKPRLKPVHKIKSLNISKHLLKSKKPEQAKKVFLKPISTSTTDDNTNTARKSIPSKTKCRSKSSPTPRQVCASESATRFTDSDVTNKKKSTNVGNCNERKLTRNNQFSSEAMNKQPNFEHLHSMFRSNRHTLTTTSPDSESAGVSQKYRPELAISMSTQTSHNVDSEASFMKIAEDKLQNMEKIADLTEKCTQRLSNLAKVLDEVRKNKSLVYSAISTSDTTSDSDQKSDKVVTPIPADLRDNDKVKLPETKAIMQEASIGTKNSKDDRHLEFTPFLIDLPKPATLKVPKSNTLQSSRSTEILNTPTDLNVTPETTSKGRPKPPPALSRIHLKHGQEIVIPHELSTVLEVDSPMSIKHKSQSSRIEIKNDVPDNSSRITNDVVEIQVRQGKNNQPQKRKEASVNPDLLESNADFNKQQSKSSTESSDDSKFKVMDLKHFNDIMLEPFISIHDYAKQFNVDTLDEGSNIDEVPKERMLNDDVSSLHSDGSLPDVIAELLKRNIITEPFKFDTASNVNSTTISSESTLSVLALSKVRKEKKKSSVVFRNKENIAETSDSLSISSNPDLENAFKRLGMGWASSTLKKTKERLALSSSSNTSSSSVSQYKIKGFNPDIPALVTDSVSSVLNSSKRDGRGKTAHDSPRNVEQQTSMINSMTVKEFLTNELANKITFTNKSNRNDTEEEFVSLFETKMPDAMKEDQSVSLQSGGNNRARTSTPVQLFKSVTYHSSSSSNVSNGLFSNADDLSSVKMTSNSMKNHSTSEKDDLTVPNFSLRMKKSSDCSKSDS